MVTPGSGSSAPSNSVSSKATTSDMRNLTLKHMNVNEAKLCELVAAMSLFRSSDQVRIAFSM
eukprot:1006653-Amphidinium_carterae.1